MDDLLLSEVNDGIATLTLNRPNQGNAFNDVLIQQLIDTLTEYRARDDIRVLQIKGNGKHFCAGADLGWMKSMAQFSYEQNIADATKLSTLFEQLDQFPTPVIGLIHGATYGGGVGIASCCDLVIATQDAKFCLSEVRLGLVAATISPYIARAMGLRNAKRYCLTTEVFDSTEAHNIGLVTHLVEDDAALQIKAQELSNQLLKNGPISMRETKSCLQALATPTDDFVRQSIELIAKVRVSAEGQEGLQAFFDKRSPKW